MFSMDSLSEFDDITGFTNVGLGAIVAFKQLPIVSFDFSADYQSHSECMEKCKVYSSFGGIDFNFSDLSDAGYHYNDINDVSYDYGFKINSLIFGFAPQVQFQVSSLLYFSIGLGVLGNYINFKQTGYQLNIDKKEWTTSAYSHSANYWAWAMQAKAVVVIKVSAHSNIDLGMCYVSTTLNELQPRNEFLHVAAPDGSSIPIIPIYEETLDNSLNVIDHLPFFSKLS